MSENLYPATIVERLRALLEAGRQIVLGRMAMGWDAALYAKIRKVALASERWEHFPLLYEGESKRSALYHSKMTHDVIGAVNLAERSIVMAAGELSSYLWRPKVIDAIRSNLAAKSKLRVRVISGRYVFAKYCRGRMELRNPLLDLRTEFPGRFLVYAHERDVREQNDMNYFHFRVVDNGTRVHFEGKHDYEIRPGEAFFGEGDTEIAPLLLGAFNQLVENDDRVVADPELKHMWLIHYSKAKELNAHYSADPEAKNFYKRGRAA